MLLLNDDLKIGEVEDGGQGQTLHINRGSMENAWSQEQGEHHHRSIIVDPDPATLEIGAGAGPKAEPTCNTERPL